MDIKFDLIIQGPIYHYTKDILNVYKNLSFINQIVISTWDEFSEYQLLFFDQKIKFIINEDLKMPGRNNRNRKIKSSLSGIKACKSDYVIVMRSDQLWDFDALEEMYSFYCEHKNPEIFQINNNNLPINKIFCVNFVQDFPFHPTDWNFWGHKTDMETFFDIPYDLDHDNPLRSEIYFASFYYSLFDKKIEFMVNNPEKYLHDNSLYIEEAKKLSKSLCSKVMKPFPKKLIKVKWLKHGNELHNWEPMEKIYDFLFHENDN